MKWSPEDFQTTKATWLAGRVLDGTIDFALWSDYLLPWSVLHERGDLWLALGGEQDKWEKANKALALLKQTDILTYPARDLAQAFGDLAEALPRFLDFFALKQEGKRLVLLLEQLELRCLLGSDLLFEEIKILKGFARLLNLLSPLELERIDLSLAQAFGDWSSAAVCLKAALERGEDLDLEQEALRLHRLAVYYFRAGELELGLSSVQKSVALNSNLAENYIYLARYYRCLGDEPMAKLQLDIAKSLTEQTQIPSLYFVEYAHCTWQFTQELEFDLLEDMLAQASWSEPEVLAEGYALLAEVYQQKGDNAKAWRANLAALRHRPLDLQRLEQLLERPEQADWEGLHQVALRYLAFFPRAADFRYRWARQLFQLTGLEEYLLMQIKFILAFDVEHELGLVYPDLKAEAEAQGQALRLRARFQTWPLDRFDQVEDDPDQDWDLSLGGAAPQDN